MRIRPLRLLWLLTLPLAAAAPASASGPSSPPSARALAASVTQLTGLSPSEVTAKDLCAVPAPGHARCAAQALVRRSNGALVRAHVQRRRRVATVLTGPRSRPAAIAAAVSTGTAPDPGSPAWLQQAYDMTYLSQTGGTNDVVAIVDAYDNSAAESDLAFYRSWFGLPPCTTGNGCFRKVNQTGAASPLPLPPPPSDPGWTAEIALDLDAVSALCPNCKILLVEANSTSLADLRTAVGTAAAMGAKQISNSWGAAWTSAPGGPFTFTGVSTIAATGDHGYVKSPYASYPAAYADVTAAGGTSLTAATDGVNARGFTESAWSLDSDGWGAGSGCTTQVPTPSYQSGLGGCGGRTYADLSADADPETGMYVYDSIDGGWLPIGGTSLASPLIAAYYAILSQPPYAIDTTKPSWAYANASLLNDAVSGWTGSCAITFVCTAVAGYDGPTGVGSISGAVVPGAPGIGGPSFESGADNTYTASADADSATLRGGVYPNSLDTTYWWEYGTSTEYGQQTAPSDIGSGHAPIRVAGELPGLAADTTYHYRLVAQNSAGTSYGYDYSLRTDPLGTTRPGTTPPSATPLPRNSSVPGIAGSPRRGSKLTASLGTWNPNGTSYSILWQRGDASGYTTIGGATASSYTPVKADVGIRLRVIVIAHNAYGSTVATSASTTPVATAPPVRGSAPVITGTARQGKSLTFRSPVWRAAPPPTRFTAQWKRCRRTGTACRSIAGARGASYRLTRADLGHRLTVTITATNPDAAVSVSSRPSAVVSAAPVVHRRRAHR